MPQRPWHRLAPGFVARVLPRVSRSRIEIPGVPGGAAADGAALLRRGLAARFRLSRGRLLALPTLEALLAARDRRLLRAVAARLPDAGGVRDVLTRPASPKARAALARLAAEEAHPGNAALFFHAGDRKAALRALRPAPEAGAGALSEAAHIRAGFLDDLPGARRLLSTASERVASTYDALGVAEAWMSIRGDRTAAAKVLEAARPRARNRNGLARLAWGWGAVLGDVDRARALLQEADALTQDPSQEPGIAKDWRTLLGDDAAARAALEALEGRARLAEDWRFAAGEWWQVFGDRDRTRAAARRGAAAARDARDRLLIAETLLETGDRAGARAQVKAAEAAGGSAFDLSLAAEARAGLLRDRKGAAAGFARALEAEENPWSVEAVVESGLKALGRRAVEPLFERRAAKAAAFADHLAFARVRATQLPDPRRRRRHIEAAAALAAEPFQKRDLARFLRDHGIDVEHADRMIEESLAGADSVEAWIALSDYKPGDPSAFFRRHWPRAAAMAGPGHWAPLLDHALSFQDPEISRLVLEALEKGEGDARDLLRASEDWRALGEDARAAEALERAERAGAPPLDVAEGWARLGRRERGAARLPEIEAAAAEDVLALGRCAQAWHALGDADRARDVLERATARARDPHEHQACATLWRNLFADLRRADACEARMGARSGDLEMKLPAFFAGIQSDPVTEVAEASFGPAAVGF